MRHAGRPGSPPRRPQGRPGPVTSAVSALLARLGKSSSAAGAHLSRYGRRAPPASTHIGHHPGVAAGPHEPVLPAEGLRRHSSARRARPGRAGSDPAVPLPAVPLPTAATPPPFRWAAGASPLPRFPPPRPGLVATPSPWPCIGRPRRL